MLFICEVAATNLRFKIVVNLRESGNSFKTFEKEIFTGGHFWTRWRSQVELGLRLLTWWDVAPVGNFLAYLVMEGFQKSKCKFKMDFPPKGLGIPLCYFCYIYLNNLKVGGSVHWQNASLLPPLLAMAAALILIFTKVATVMVMVTMMVLLVVVMMISAKTNLHFHLEGVPCVKAEGPWGREANITLVSRRRQKVLYCFLWTLNHKLKSKKNVFSLLRAHLEEELDQMTLDSKASPGLAKSLVVLLSKQHRWTMLNVHWIFMLELWRCWRCWTCWPW